MFYVYVQNNTGGEFDATMPRYLIIEAETAGDANQRAEDAGVYFNGVDAGVDCGCCGDRWDRAWEWDGTNQPCLYGEPVLEKMADANGYFYTSDTVRIVYANGRRIDIKMSQKEGV